MLTCVNCKTFFYVVLLNVRSLFDNIDQVTHHSNGYDISEYKVQKIVKDFDVSISSAYA